MKRVIVAVMLSLALSGCFNTFYMSKEECSQDAAAWEAHGAYDGGSQNDMPWIEAYEKNCMEKYGVQVNVEAYMKGWAPAYQRSYQIMNQGQ